MAEGADVCVRTHLFCPWPLDEFGVEYLLPTVEALHVAPVIKPFRNLFPVFALEKRAKSQCRMTAQEA
jgi:hypothetical protein